jgi:hypothetical protein
MLSFAARVHLVSINIDGITKQVGFAAAPNWVIVYLLLYPTFVGLFLFCAQIFEKSIQNLCDDHVISGPNGTRINAHRILELWHHQRTRYARVIMFLFVVTIIQGYLQWALNCAVPLLTGSTEGAVLDWATVPAVLNWSPSRTNLVIIFSFIAYSYMIIALCIFLFSLFYCVQMMMFVHYISIRGGDFRLIYRQREIGRELGIVFRASLLLIILGIFAALLMSIQSHFLRSDSDHILSFMFSDFAIVWRWLSSTLMQLPLIEGPGTATIGDLATRSNITFMTSVAVTIYSVFCLAGILFPLHLAMENARSYVQEKADDADWRKRVDLTETDVRAIIKDMENGSYVTKFTSDLKHAGIVLALSVVIAIFPRFGSLLITTIVYVFMTLVMDAIRGFWAMRRQGDPPATNRPSA